MSAEICSRCGQGLFAEDNDFLAGLRDTCFGFLLSRWDGRIADCLDSLDRPGAILAGDLTVLLPNRLLQRACDPAAAERRIGDVLGCVHAVLRGRCGETAACLPCGIRKSVEHTLATGEKVYRYPANIQKRSGANQDYALITAKAADAVLLILQPPPRA